MSVNRVVEEALKKWRKPSIDEHERSEPLQGSEPLILSLQHQVGNRAVQRLVQESGEKEELDEKTSRAIHQQRGSGANLDTGLQREMTAALGYDFSRVHVHTSPQADRLNQQLNSAAFTTGSDIFFRQGQYEPGSNPGKELIAHELTHVAQQAGSQVDAGSPLAVGEPDDVFEQQADEVARQVVGKDRPQAVSKSEDEEQEAIQTKHLDEPVHLPGDSDTEEEEQA